MPSWTALLSLPFYRILLFNTLRILVLIVFAWVGTLVARRILLTLRRYAVRVMMRTGGRPQSEVDKQAQTIGAVLYKTLVAMVWTMVTIMILKEMNFDVRPLLAGAGVVGVAIGFGAQSLIKDVLAGFFILLDNQIRINDVAVINGTGGLVEEINLRTTILRSEDGAVHIFPNGSIQRLSNLTRDFSYAVLNVAVSYRDDTDRVVALLREVADQLRQEQPYKEMILEPLDMMGVDQLGESWCVVKARMKTLPIQQWTVGREMNRRIKKRFEEEGLSPAFPARSLEMRVGPDLRGEVEEWVREAMKGGPELPKAT